MDNNKTVLIAVLLVIGLGAIYFSMKNNTKEGFAGGMPQRAARIEKLVVPASSNLKASINGGGQINYQGAQSLNFSNNPNFQISSPNVQYPYQSVQEGFDSAPSASLGSSANTNLPFVSQPNYQQTTPLVAPSVAYSALERYQPTSTSNMGRTDSFNCAGGYGIPVEGFTEDVDTYPGVNYSAGNYNNSVAQLQTAKDVSATLASSLDVLSPTGENKQVLVIDRPYSVNLKAGRFNRAPGTVDWIRGDAPVPTLQGNNNWFKSSGSPADLTVGSMSVIAGVNEADHVMKSLKAAYGAVGGGGYNAPKDFNYAAMNIANLQSNLGDTVQMTAAAFP